MKASFLHSCVARTPESVGIGVPPDAGAAREAQAE